MRKSLLLSLAITLLLGISSQSLGAAHLISDTVYNAGGAVTNDTFFYYNAQGFPTADSIKDATGKLLRWIVYTCDANGNVTQREERSPATPATAALGYTPRQLNVYVIQSNKVAIDSFWMTGAYASPTPGARHTNLTSMDLHHYNADNTPSIDSICDTAGKMSTYFVYKYSADIDSVIQYDTSKTKVALTVLTKTNGNITSIVNYTESSQKADSATNNTQITYDANNLISYKTFNSGSGNNVINTVYYNWSNTAIFNVFLNNGIQSSGSPFTALKLANVNNTVNLSFTLSAASPVAVRLFNPSGSLVASLPSAWFSSGTHSVALANVGPLSDGRYIVDIGAGGRNLTKSVSLMR